jgi:hypothetical protein
MINTASFEPRAALQQRLEERLVRIAEGRVIGHVRGGVPTSLPLRFDVVRPS